MRGDIDSGSGAAVVDWMRPATPGAGADRSRLLRVCFVINVPPERYSGATFHAIWLAERLARWDVQVEFLAFSRERRETDRMPGGRPVHFVRTGSGRFAELVLWSDLLRFFQRNRRYDLVHSHSCGYRESFLPLAARRAGIPSIANVMLQGVDLGFTGRFEVRVRNRLIRLYDRVVPISDETYREALAAGLKPERLMQIPIAVDTERFRPAPGEVRRRLRAEYGLPLDRPVVAFIGAFNARKNVVWLLDSWLARPEALVDAHLLLLGDAIGDPEGPEVRRQVEARLERAGSSVRWIPFVREVERVYQASDALALPSLAEGMPSVVLQAMASGLPVVATPAAGVPELLGRAGERGLLFEFNDRRGLWAGLEAILADRDRHRALAEAARAHVLAHCSLEVVARRYRDLYLSLIEPERAHRMRGQASAAPL